MDLASLGQVFLIWMLLSVTLGDCATSKSKMHNVLSNLDGSIIRFNVFPMLLIGVNGRRHPPRFWWKEPKQYIHWDLVETNVWHITLEIKDRNFLLHYRVSSETFNNLVLELTPFLQSSCLNPVRSQLEIKQIVVIDLLIYSWI
jgi:hypothetical protein